VSAETGVAPGAGSALAPFRQRAFAWLWLGVVVASVGMWAQTVGAQWLFVDDPNAATIVALVQTATQLPVVLLALPAGVLSDAFDRRWLLFATQAYVIVVAAVMAVLAAAGRMTPGLMLALMFAAGAGLAFQVPTWQPLIAELVPRSQLAAATRLDMVSVNVARAAGPAIAGAIIAAWGVPPVFAFTAVCSAVLATILLAWRRPEANLAGDRERFLPALRAGGRYVRHEPVVRVILGRLAMFVAPAAALWALLPLIASQQLGLQAGGYGLLFAALGVGAVLGALTLGHVTRHMSSNTLLSVVGLAYAAALAGTMLAPGLVLAIPLLVVAGYGWTATVSTVNAELQLFLPGWVRARAIAVYLMSFLGTMAVASPLWGALTQAAGLTAAVYVAAALVAVGAVAGLAVRIPESETADRAALAYWNDPSLGIAPEPVGGPVQVIVEYHVPPDREAEWLSAMQAMRRSRLRSGAFRWELYRVGERPDRFVEIFAVPSWAEHERQHQHRLTAEDQAIEEAAFAYTTSTPSAEHLLPPQSRADPAP
jgi:MFS family permease